MPASTETLSDCVNDAPCDGVEESAEILAKDLPVEEVEPVMEVDAEAPDAEDVFAEDDLPVEEAEAAVEEVAEEVEESLEPGESPEPMESPLDESMIEDVQPSPEQSPLDEALIEDVEASPEASPDMDDIDEALIEDVPEGSEVSEKPKSFEGFMSALAQEEDFADDNEAPAKTARRDEAEGDFVEDEFDFEDEIEEGVTYDEVFPESQKRGRDPDVFEEGGATSTQQNPEEGKNAFEAGLARLKKRRKRQDVNPEDAVNKMEMLIARMEEAKKLDQGANKVGKPALNKLRLLEEVMKVLNKVVWQEWFVTSGGCAALVGWLQPLPDGSEPSLTLREHMLTLIEKLPITQENLRQSQLGKVIKAMLMNPNETMTNRARCQALISSWLRGIFGQSISETRHRSEQQRHLEPVAKPVAAQKKTKAELRKELEESNSRRHPQMFQKAENVFKVQPRSEVEPAPKAPGPDTKRGKLTRNIAGLHGNGSVVRSSKHTPVSVEGRGLNLSFD